MLLYILKCTDQCMCHLPICGCVTACYSEAPHIYVYDMADLTWLSTDFWVFQFGGLKKRWSQSEPLKKGPVRL